jgi:hypothetical protein
MYRAFYAEHCLGSTLEYEDLPEALRPYFYPTNVVDNLSANTSTLYSSTLWPMLNRVTAQAIEDYSTNVSNNAARTLR